MKISVLTYPNSKLEYLKNILNYIEENSIKPISFDLNWRNLKNSDNIEGLKIYALSDPFESIKDSVEDIISKDEQKIKKRKFIDDILKIKMKYNMSDYNELESACLSYLMWVESAKESNLDLIFKIEDLNDLFVFLKDNGILDKDFNYNSKSFKSYKPRNLDEYKSISYGTINLLGLYCEEYNYLNFLKGMK